MKAQKIAELEPVEITRQAQEAQEQLFRFRFQMGMGQFEGLKKYRILKKDRARLLTVLRDKELNAGNTAKVAAVKTTAAAQKTTAAAQKTAAAPKKVVAAQKQAPAAQKPTAAKAKKSK
jgi:large subunit ribosomal protein L29